MFIHVHPFSLFKHVQTSLFGDFWGIPISFLRLLGHLGGPYLQLLLTEALKRAAEELLYTGSWHLLRII